MFLKINYRYLLGFLSLVMIMGISHELLHHITGSIICWCIGIKTFNSFGMCSDCTSPYKWIATIIAPIVFNYIPMWIGYFKLKSKDVSQRLLGFALIFSVLPIMRIVFSLMGANDEPAVVRHLFGNGKTPQLIMSAIILVITIPPLVKAYLGIQNKYRILWFLGFFIFPSVFVFFFVGVFLEGLIVKKQFLYQTILGMPLLVLVFELLSFIGYRIYKKEITRT